jgi:hypothetical protein
MESTTEPRSCGSIAIKHFFQHSTFLSYLKTSVWLVQRLERLLALRAKRGIAASVRNLTNQLPHALISSDCGHVVGCRVQSDAEQCIKLQNTLQTEKRFELNL